MDYLLGFAAQIVEQIPLNTITPIGSHIGCAIHYREKIGKLEFEMGELERARRCVQGRVDRAQYIGEIVRADVSEWLETAQRTEREVREFLNLTTQGENPRRYSYYFGGCSCPNVRSRYQVGKMAEEKTAVVIGLKDLRNFNPVAKPAPPPEFTTDDYQKFESRVSAFKNIMEALKEEEISIIGVYGMGGVGKTRMVEEVGRQAKADMMFYEVVKADASQTPDVRRIQGELADRLGIKLVAETKVGRADQLCNKMKTGKKILVIIDDVWEEINLNEIGIPCGDPRCKVVLTSRERGVFLLMNVRKDFHIGELCEQEAWAMFTKKVGSHIKDLPKICTVAQDVCRECRGLPIAILAVGGSLMKHRHKEAWDDALEQLRISKLSNVEGAMKKVFSPLKLSYDYLDSKDAQSCFLLCALFPEDAEIPVDGLLRYGMGTGMVARVDTMEKTRNRVYTLVHRLKESCLLLEGRERNFVKMHDVIRDVALSIASDNKQAFLVKTGLREWPSIGSYDCLAAISLSFNEHNINALPDDFECPNLTTLLLYFRDSEASVQVPDKFFDGMVQLKVLKLAQMSLLPHLPSSFCNLVNLQMLVLCRCKLPDMSMVKKLKKLEILSFEGSDITALPPQIGDLTSLRLLDLTPSYPYRRRPLPVLSSLSNLEVLYIDMNFKWKAISKDESRSNAFFVELNSLPRLIDLRIHIGNVDILPNDMKLLFNRLDRFEISMEFFPSPSSFIHRSFSRYGTRQLRLKYMPLKDGAKILSEKAEQLILDNVTGLKVLKDTEKFLDLKELLIDGCDDVEHMFSKLNWVSQSHGLTYPFSKLTRLSIYSCGLRYLFSPSIARRLVQLQYLSIEHCKDFGKLIGNEGNGDKEEVTDSVIFTQLTELRLWDLPNLVSIYPELQHTLTSDGNPNPVEFLFNQKVAFPALETLVLWSLPKIRGIWGNKLPVESFSKLSEIDISQCQSLRDVFTSSTVRCFVHFQELSISSCENMKQIVGTEKKEEESNDEIVFPQLKTLVLRNLCSLRSFCNSRYEENDHDKALGTANQEINQPSLPPLFDDKVAFPCLEKLRICNLNLKELRPSSRLPNNSSWKLSDLDITDCRNLLNVDESKLRESFPTLQHCRIQNSKRREEWRQSTFVRAKKRRVDTFIQGEEEFDKETDNEKEEDEDEDNNDDDERDSGEEEQENDDEDESMDSDDDDDDDDSMDSDD